MIIGRKENFAIEHEITEVYQRLGAKALGFFVIYVDGRCFGIRRPDATLLACSFDKVQKLVCARGHESASFLKDVDSFYISKTVFECYHGDLSENSYFGMSPDEFDNWVVKAKIIWAPDGDQAFDDGSFILRLEVEDRVRLIAFRATEKYVVDVDSLAEVTVGADVFYSILAEWLAAFETERSNLLSTNNSNGDNQ